MLKGLHYISKGLETLTGLLILFFNRILSYKIKNNALESKTPSKQAEQQLYPDMQIQWLKTSLQN